jgi:hypothetical protein
MLLEHLCSAILQPHYHALGWAMFDGSADEVSAEDALYLWD